jgi:hypothetical protein
LYIPNPSEQEILKFNELVENPSLPIEEVKKRFKVIGGVIRGIFNEYEKHKNDMRDAVQFVDIRDFTNFLGKMKDEPAKELSASEKSGESNQEKIVVKDKVASHKVIHYEVNTDTFTLI